jgi:hypothetical protein
VVDHLQGVARGVGQRWLRANEPAEENDAILVGDGWDGVDDLDRGRVTQQADECLSRFAPPHAPESAGSRAADVAVAVAGQIEERLEDGWPWRGAATGIGAHLGIGIVEEVKESRRAGLT